MSFHTPELHERPSITLNKTDLYAQLAANKYFQKEEYSNSELHHRRCRFKGHYQHIPEKNWGFVSFSS